MHNRKRSQYKRAQLLRLLLVPSSVSWAAPITCPDSTIFPQMFGPKTWPDPTGLGARVTSEFSAIDVDDYHEFVLVGGMMVWEKKTFKFNSFVRYCETDAGSTCDPGQPTDPAFKENGHAALLRLYKLTDYGSEFTFIAATTTWDKVTDVAAIKLLNEESNSAEMDAAKVDYPSIDTNLDTVGKVLFHMWKDSIY